MRLYFDIVDRLFACLSKEFGGDDTSRFTADGGEKLCAVGSSRPPLGFGAGLRFGQYLSQQRPVA